MAVLACGTMGTAILSGVLDCRRSQEQGNQSSELSSSISEEESIPLPTRYIATVNRPESKRRLEKYFKDEGHEVEVVQQDNVKAVQQADVVLICCKPQLLPHMLKDENMRNALNGKILISIAAGVTIEQIKNMAPTAIVVRAMPNTPSKIRQGMTVISELPKDSPEDAKALLKTIFAAVGRCRFLDEKHFDAATALAGSGPAFTTLFLEAMTDGGVMMGLPRPEALELAAQTIQGAARMVLETGRHPAAIKDSVTTPGGCTIAGLLQMEDGRLRSTVARSIQTAAEHAAGLGKN
ncbi:pyrroline-5-carboxylate reductase [Malassezia yamatoensis]|uniref:Pyrroline-5-carboxylate reductase n=1 Tax=Malassezia yamatoensis TaxID=253288 RepID=A0AAJ6CFQ6_9BASI|nr:pyrroline-5-carboxylate reductase [Malassezia yamatoensis]